MDGNTSVSYECKVFDRGHFAQYDPASSSADKSVYTCACGHTITEFEDCNSGG